MKVFCLVAALGIAIVLPTASAQDAPAPLPAPAPAVTEIAPTVTEIAPDATLPPAVAALLPPASEAAGASVRVMNAGFRLYAQSPQVPYFFVEAISTPGSQARMHRIVGPVELTTNDFFYPAAVRGGDKRVALRWTAPNIDPRWERVRVFLKIIAPNAPKEADGTFNSEFRFRLPLPELGQTIPLERVFTTRQGSVCQFVSITNARPQGNNEGDSLDNADGTLSVAVRIRRPAAAPNARVSFALGNWTIEGKKWAVQSRNLVDTPEEVVTQLRRPPAEIKSMDATLWAREWDAQWIQPQYFGTAAFDLPVAALLKANPLAPPAQLPALSEATIAGGRARVSAPVWNGKGWKLRLWTEHRAKTPSDNPQIATRLIATNAVAKFADGQEYRWSAAADNISGDLFFGPDNSVLARDEAGQEIVFRGAPLQGGAPIALTVTTRERRLYSSFHEFRALPVPPMGETRNLDENWSDESAIVQRIGWTDKERLAVICENVSLWNGQFNTFSLSSAAVDNNDQPLRNSYQFDEMHDLLQNERTLLKPGTFIFALDAPTLTKTIDLSYGFTELKDGASHTFVWPNLSAADK